MKHSTFKFVGCGKGINGSAWERDGVEEFAPEFNENGMLVNAPTDFFTARAIGLPIKGFKAVFKKDCMGATFFFKS